jgi:hypothetical protein
MLSIFALDLVVFHIDKDASIACGVCMSYIRVHYQLWHTTPDTYWCTNNVTNLLAGKFPSTFRRPS